MKKARSFPFRLAGALAGVLLLVPVFSQGKEKLQFELFGGVSFINPKDFNLFSRAEEQYNFLYFIRLLGDMPGYFINEFPRIKSALPAGLRVKYWISPALALSLGIEGLLGEKEADLEGTFSYDVSGRSERHTKRYAPYRLGLSGYALLAGVHFRKAVGNLTDLEVGAAAGWAKAGFDYSSTWTYDAEYRGLTREFSFADGGTLEGDGSGQGVMAQGMLRLVRMLGRKFGFFVEGAYSYCRLTSINGSGREARRGIPDETRWEGVWGIRKESIQMSWGEVVWGEAEVMVPSNYWEGWTEAQRDRDFRLDLSGFRLAVGIQFRL